MKIGAAVVSEVVEGRPRSTVLKDRHPFRGPKGDFVRLTLSNLGWAKVGPVLVSVDVLPRDETTGGVASDARLVRARRAGADAVIADVSRTKLSSAGPSLQSVLIFDPASNRIVSGAVATNTRSGSSRTLEIEVVNEPIKELLEVGPGQPLLIERKSAAAAMGRAHACQLSSAGLGFGVRHGGGGDESQTVASPPGVAAIP